jgi:predicted glutamine amidotransferase
MCRLYAMHANEPMRVECGLVNAQNALMVQSQGGIQGYAHGHGWGLADYPDGVPIIEKQTWAAFHGEHFARKAARIYARTVVAHVRRATVGGTSIENTHPFSHGH